MWFRNQNLSVHFPALSGLVSVGHDVAKLNERCNGNDIILIEREFDSIPQSPSADPDHCTDYMKWKMKREEISYKNCSPDERESKKVLDSEFHTVDSGFKVMHSDSLSVELGFPIPICSGFPDS